MSYYSYDILKAHISTERERERGVLQYLNQYALKDSLVICIALLCTVYFHKCCFNVPSYNFIDRKCSNGFHGVQLSVG